MLLSGYAHFTRNFERSDVYCSHTLMHKAARMTDDQFTKEERGTAIAHYAWFFALWVLLIGLGFAANHFGRDSELADFAYVLFTASVAVALLHQLWEMKRDPGRP